MHTLIRDLYPICRSITGDGLRRTFDRLSRDIALRITEVPSGTQVLDWTVPDEWNIRDAWVKDPSGRKIVDFRDHTLAVVNYSRPVARTVPLAELQKHLHALPDQPDLIPYRTSYYERTWGFCLPDRTRKTLIDGEYEVFIDATLEPGSLTLAEHVLPGETDDEILITAHSCHPSLANDNLPGIAVAVELARHFAAHTLRHTPRIAFLPVTIGSIAWLHLNRDRVDRIKHALSLVCLSDATPVGYKTTVGGDHVIDRAARAVLTSRFGRAARIIEFYPYGYDERQFNAPGFRVPMGSVLRGQHGRFPEYHISADTPDFVRPDKLQEALEIVIDIIETADSNRTCRNLAPFGEPQLGRRGIYKAMGGSGPPDIQMAMLWVPNLSDGAHDLLAISERSGVACPTIRAAAEILKAHSLLE